MKKFDLEAELSRLPENPGVYIMYSFDGKVIYVGKAKILKNRVRQYFRHNKGHTDKVRAMVSNIAYFEYIITDSETEALVLESNLIKKHRPKYNILLKDDKQYPYIKVTMNERYPRIILARNLEDDGAKYFGPYASSATVYSVIELVSKIFKQPKCRRKFPQDIGKGRPCLNYHIKACFAPCTGNVPEEEYRAVFNSICTFLSGDHKKLIDSLTLEMQSASKNLEYEKAAMLRDEINGIIRLDEKQKIVNSDNMTDMDIIASAVTGDNAFCEIFFVRKGRIVGKENLRMVGVNGQETDEILSVFVRQFYQNATYIPDEIITQVQISELELIKGWLSSIKGKNVRINTPVRGEKKKIMEMVEKNAENARAVYLSIQQKSEIRKGVLFDLAKAAGLKEPPEYIEAYDISNISGTDNVGSMVVFKNGKPYKSRYRQFNIKSFEGQDDYRSMQEVIYRRIKHAYDEQNAIENGEIKPENAKFLPLPDLMLIDGGEKHLAAANEMIEMMSADIKAFGMVKDDKHRTRALVSADGEIALSPSGSVFKLITSIQDEAHRSAITHHRKKRVKKLRKSELDNINGIGEKRKAMLLSRFKSIKAIKEADFDTLISAGVDKKTAENIIEYFKNK